MVKMDKDKIKEIKMKNREEVDNLLEEIKKYSRRPFCLGNGCDNCKYYIREIDDCLILFIRRRF